MTNKLFIFSLSKNKNLKQKNSSQINSNQIIIIIIFLFLRQPKITLFIYLLIKQQGEQNTIFYSSGVFSVYLV